MKGPLRSKQTPENHPGRTIRRQSWVLLAAYVFPCVVAAYLLVTGSISALETMPISVLALAPKETYERILSML